MQFNWPLIGHEHIKQYFEKALLHGRVHHAYLFEGPEQVGKTTFAVLLAKTLLCEETQCALPCNVCRSCEAFAHNAHPDFLELARGEDAHLSIEKAREFSRAFTTRPLLGPLKIGIIAEAALLTPEAANALLKTLEEPPEFAVLFLITREPLLPTVMSRCQRITFRFVGTYEMTESFPPEVASLAAGRPGVALQMKDADAQESYRTQLKETKRLLTMDEGERLMWVVEQFSDSRNAATRRELARDMFMMIEHVLREALIREHDYTPRTIISMLHRIAASRRMLPANVDPRLICEYVLLNHEV